MEYIHKIKEKACDALDDIGSSERLNMMDNSDRKIVGELVDIIKDIEKIEEMYDDDGSYPDGEWDAKIRGSYGRGSSYGRDGRGMPRGRMEPWPDGYSSARRKRDSRGRYSRDDGAEEMMKHIDEMMMAAETPEQREAIERFRRQMEKA